MQGAHSHDLKFEYKGCNSSEFGSGTQPYLVYQSNTV